MSIPRFTVHAAAIAFALLSAAVLGQAQKADPAAESSAQADGPIVKVRQGEAQGIVADGVAIFKGLPFAAPPDPLPLPPRRPDAAPPDSPAYDPADLAALIDVSRPRPVFRHIGTLVTAAWVVIFFAYCLPLSPATRAGLISVAFVVGAGGVVTLWGLARAHRAEMRSLENIEDLLSLRQLDRAGAESLCVFISDDLVVRAWHDLSRPDLVDEGPTGDRIPQFPDLVFRPDPEVGAALTRLRDSYGEDDPSAMALEERLLDLVVRLVAAAQGHRRLIAQIPAVKASTRKLLVGRLQRARAVFQRQVALAEQRGPTRGTR